MTDLLQFTCKRRDNRRLAKPNRKLELPRASRRREKFWQLFGWSALIGLGAWVWFLAGYGLWKLLGK